MPRFPQSFIDDVRAAADIVAVVQDVVSLRRVGATYKGLCPFHGEKTPSFHVNRERGFFHCFGCGVGGDVFKFVELHEKVGFLEAARTLAQRFGVSIPTAATEQDVVKDAERETLLKVHEVAARYFREQLDGPAGERARAALRDRTLRPETIERLGLGFAPPARDGLKSRLLKQGFSQADILRSGVIVQREDGTTVDRFRNRLMIPICRDSGPVIAFGGRSMDKDQQPKYLNSPETLIYQKGRILYGLHLTKAAIRRAGRCVLVEGYFDFAQVLQSGLEPVAATCGTALTGPQTQLLQRLAGKAVLSFDPDAAGQSAAARSCDLLVSQGLEVLVALLPAGSDPDTFVKERGGAAYQDLIERAQPWLEYLEERASVRHAMNSAEGRRAFLHEMLHVANSIPDAVTRDQFADRIAHRARVADDLVRAEIRKAAVARRPESAVRVTLPSVDLKPAERDLLATLVQDPGEVVLALAELDEDDLDGLRSAPILRIARAAGVDGRQVAPTALLERLNESEARLLTGLAAATASPAPPAECVRALRAIRLQRERADVQREIDRLQELGAEQHAGQIAALWHRKKDLLQRLEALDS